MVKLLEWYSKHNISIRRRSSSKIDRALNVFSYNFTYNRMNTESALIWSLIGLECLFCDGDGKSKQIHDKAQVLFGDMISFKDKLKKLYGFRSRLIHGKMDIPPNQFDMFSNRLDYHEELDKYATLACLLLTYTLLDMILRNATALNFKYSLGW